VIGYQLICLISRPLLIALRHDWYRLKGLLKGFKLALRQWESLKNWWRYDQMKFVTLLLYFIAFSSLSLLLFYLQCSSQEDCQGRNSRGRRYRVIDRNHTPFRSNIQRQRGMYLVIIERRLQQWDKDVGVKSNLLNDLDFNLYVALRSPVMRLVAYFGVKEVAKTEVLRSRVKESE